jgi:hypothetical protein
VYSGSVAGYVVELVIDSDRSAWLGALDGKHRAVSNRIAAKVFLTPEEALAAASGHAKNPDVGACRYKLCAALLADPG